jgi:methylamine dehydrogenase accessory protein MauD
MTFGLILAVVLQWVFLAALAIIVFALARQVGILHQRLGPAGAMAIQKNAIKIGERSPEFKLHSILDSRAVVIGGQGGDGRSTLVMFVAPECPICAQLMPALKSIGAQEAKWLRLVFASDGEPESQRRFWSGKGMDDYPYVLSQELGLTFRIGQLPYGILLDPDGVLVAQGLCNNREHIDSLFEAQRLGVASIQEYLSREKQVVGA